MAPSPQVREAPMYGTSPEVSVEGSAPKRSAKWVRVGAVLFLGAVACAALVFKSTQRRRSPWLENIQYARHECPQWPIFCHEHQNCLDHFQRGKVDNPIIKSLCREYVRDCKDYCEECACVASGTESSQGDKFCEGLIGACLHPELYMTNPGFNNVDKFACPHNWVQVGTMGADVRSKKPLDPEISNVGFTSIVQCAAWCYNNLDCESFTFHRGRASGEHGDEKYICRRYATANADAIAMGVGGTGQIMCKPVNRATPNILNPECPFENSGVLYQQKHKMYPVCPTGATPFGLDQGGFCCTPAPAKVKGDPAPGCIRGKEGTYKGDKICAIVGNPRRRGHPTCKKQPVNRYCMWAAGAFSKYDTETWKDYTLRTKMAFDGQGSAGILFRMSEPWKKDSPRYWLKFSKHTEDSENEIRHALSVTHIDAKGKETKLKDNQWEHTPYTQCKTAIFKSDKEKTLAACKKACLDEYNCGGILYDPNGNLDPKNKAKKKITCIPCVFGSQAALDSKGADFFRRPGTFAQLWDKNGKCTGKASNTVLLTGSSAKHCRGCWNSCTDEYSGAFQSIRIYGPGRAAISTKCLGSDDGSHKLGAGFADTGGTITEGAGCVATGNREEGPWKAVRGKAVVLCSGEVSMYYQDDLFNICPKNLAESHNSLNNFEPKRLYNVELVVNGFVFKVLIDKILRLTVADERLSYGSIGFQTYRSGMIAHSLQLLNARGAPLMDVYRGAAAFSSEFEMFVDGRLAYSGTGIKVSDRKGVQGYDDGMEGKPEPFPVQFDGATKIIAVKMKLAPDLVGQGGAVRLEYRDLHHKTIVAHPYPPYIRYLLKTFPEDLVGKALDRVSAFTGIQSRDDNGKIMRSNLVWMFNARFCEPEGAYWDFQVGPDFGKGGRLYIDNTLVSIHHGDIWWNKNWVKALRSNDLISTKNVFLSEGRRHQMAVFGLENCCGGPISMRFRRGKTAKTMGPWMEFSEENLMPLCESPTVERFSLMAGTGKGESCTKTLPTLCEARLRAIQKSFLNMKFVRRSIFERRGLTPANVQTRTAVQQYLYDFEPQLSCPRPCIHVLPDVMTNTKWKCLRTDKPMVADAKTGITWKDEAFDHKKWDDAEKVKGLVPAPVREASLFNSKQATWIGAPPREGKRDKNAYLGCYKVNGMIKGKVNNFSLVKTWDDTPYSRSISINQCRLLCKLTPYYGVGYIPTKAGTKKGDGIGCYCIKSFDDQQKDKDEVCGKNVEVMALKKGQCSGVENLSTPKGPQWCVKGQAKAGKSLSVFRESYDTTYCVYKIPKCAGSLTKTITKFNSWYKAKKRLARASDCTYVCSDYHKKKKATCTCSEFSTAGDGTCKLYAS